MEINVSQHQGRVPVTVFHLIGNLANEEPLRSEVQQAYDAGMRYLLLDLTGVPYMSSGGLRAINYAYTLLRQSEPPTSSKAISQGIAAGTYHSPHLKLLSPSKRALETISIAGFDMFLEIHKNLAEAVASF